MEPEKRQQGIDIELNHRTIDIVRRYPDAAMVLTNRDIDFCCINTQTFEQACRIAHIEPKQLISEIREAVKRSNSARDLNEIGKLDADEICCYIQQNHHHSIKVQSTRISQLAAKVAGKYGHKNPELNIIKALFEELSGKLNLHIRKEEMVLFPCIKKLSKLNRGEPVKISNQMASIEAPIAVMNAERKIATDLMKEIRIKSADYLQPDPACNSFMVLYHLLNKFEQDLEQHSIIEDQYLFPKALEIERKFSERKR